MELFSLPTSKEDNYGKDITLKWKAFIPQMCVLWMSACPIGRFMLHYSIALSRNKSPHFWWKKKVFKFSSLKEWLQLLRDRDTGSHLFVSAPISGELPPGRPSDLQLAAIFLPEDELLSVLSGEDGKGDGIDWLVNTFSLLGDMIKSCRVDLWRWWKVLEDEGCVFRHELPHLKRGQVLCKPVVRIFWDVCCFLPSGLPTE